MNNIIIGISEYNGYIILLKYDDSSKYDSVCSKCAFRGDKDHKCNGEYNGCKNLIIELLNESECDDINRVIDDILRYVRWEYMGINHKLPLFKVSYIKINLGRLLIDKPVHDNL